MRQVAIAGLIIGIMLGVGLPALDAAYIIKLKNGKEYVTNRYWRKRDQLLFDTYGGTFGIDRRFVVKIEQTNQTVSLPSSPAAIDHGDSPSSLEKEPRKQNAQVNETRGTEGAQATTTKTSKKDDAVVKQYEELQQRFNQLNDLPKHEVHALEADIQAFREKLSQVELAETYKDEIATMGTLLRAIAAYLKASYP